MSKIVIENLDFNLGESKLNPVTFASDICPLYVHFLQQGDDSKTATIKATKEYLKLFHFVQEMTEGSQVDE